MPLNLQLHTESDRRT